jgi:23S rRNA (uracil1939-C5)-methyltransferase
VRVTLDRLDARHTSGLDAAGRRWSIRGAPPGAVIDALPGKKGTARRLGLVQPAPGHVAPRCPVFGLCGGCQLQELPVAAQLDAKRDLLLRQVQLGPEDGVRIFPVVPSTDDGYGYRNKLELSFSSRPYFPEDPRDAPPDADDGEAAGAAADAGPVDPRGAPTVLGFHPPGWWSKVIPVSACPLGVPAMQPVIARVAAMDLRPAWDPFAHTGVWRHLVLRDAGRPGAPRLTVSLVTSSAADPDEVGRVGAELARLPAVEAVLHVVTDRPAEVAQGELRAVLFGDPTLEFALAGARLRLPHDAFFQVNTPGAERLVEEVAAALGLGPGRSDEVLYDLYCGVGTFGLALGSRVARVVGVELHEGAVACARENAALNGVEGEWHAGRVEEVLPRLGGPPPRRLVVDPPRAGLHPAAAAFLAALPAERLVYVACGPEALGRDRRTLEAGGWRLQELRAVDLFPQTHHMEAVALFTRSLSLSAVSG